MKKNLTSLLEIILTVSFVSISLFIIVRGYVYQTIIAYILFFVLWAIYIRFRDGNPHKYHLQSCMHRAQEALLTLEIINIEGFSPALFETEIFKKNSLRKLIEWNLKYKSLYSDIRLVNPKSSYLGKKKFEVLNEFVHKYESAENIIHFESIKIN